MEWACGIDATVGQERLLSIRRGRVGHDGPIRLTWQVMLLDGARRKCRGGKLRSRGESAAEELAGGKSLNDRNNALASGAK